MRRKNQGFTLIEMMIVVVIIAILAAVAIVAYTRHIKKSRIVAEKVFVTKIQALQETYFQQYGVYYDVTGTANPYPGTMPSGEHVVWTSAGAGAKWSNLGARPESNRTFFQWWVVGSELSYSTHNVSGIAGSLGIVSNQSPWYYIYGKADMDGDGAAFTEIFATSRKTQPWTQNEGE